MDRMSKKAVLKTSVATLLVSSAFGAFAPTYAQTASAADGAKVEDIVVTGSRIARPDLESSSPVTVVTSENLKLSGTTSTEDFLRDLPVAVAAIGGNSNNGNPGVATLDLRNLSEERTLVLVDGKRFVPYDSNGFVDLNMIPASLVKRVEVLTGGASSVYGSDAVAGVVNFILKDDFSGFEADAQLGVTGKGDGFSQAYSITSGLSSEKGNLVINAQYVRVNPVDLGARDFSRFSLSTEDLAPSGGSSTNAAGAIDGLVALGGRGTFDASGNLVPYDAVRDSFNFNPYNLLQVPQNKWTATAIGKYELSESVEFFSRFSFANSQVTTVIAPSGTFGFPYNINYADNPFLSAQAKGILAQNDTADAGDKTPGDGVVKVPLRRRTLELGTRDSIYENTAYQLVGGFRGDISDSLRWEAFGQYGHTSRTTTYANDIRFDLSQQAILAVRNPDTGAIVCEDPSGGCVPANLFGAGNLSQAAGNFFRVDLQQIESTSQFIVGGFVNYDLPFSLLSDKKGGVVVGVEYRRENAIARPDNNLLTGNSVGFGSSTPIKARLSTKEVYGELNLPIVSGQTFFDSLSLEAGIRYADYANRDELQSIGNKFSNTSWKLGLEWTPVAGFKLRGGFNRAIRAPNLNEIGQPVTPGTGDATYDHCESIKRGQPIVLDSATVGTVLAGTAPANTTALFDLCRATGVPLTALQNGLVDGIVSGQINNYTGGNIRLTPERADTYTIGLVMQPEFLSGFSASVDYFDIRVKNAIYSVPEQEALIGCYEVEKNASGFFCSRIRRNPITGSLSGGTETGVDSSTINIGGARSKGIDIAVSYRFALNDNSNLAFAINATHTINSILDYGTSVRECVGKLGKICVRPQPKWQWVQTTTLDSGPWSLQFRWQYIGKLERDDVAFGLGGAKASDFALPMIKAKHYFDLFTSFEATEALSLRFGINNLFDKKPPIVGTGYGGTTENSANTYPATYDPLGRSYFVGATMKF